MRRYLKSITTFRALFLFVLFVSLGAGVYDFARRPVAVRSAENEEHRLKVLRDGAESVGPRLAAIEEIGVSLAENIEAAFGETDVAFAFEQTLNDALASALLNAPSYVEGLGIERRIDTMRETTLRTRNGTFFTTPPVFLAGIAGRKDGDTAREINLGRSVNWRIAIEAAGEGRGRISLLLAVSTRKRGEPDIGDSLVKAELGWLGDVLADMEESGAGRFFCLTPHDDMLWQVDRHLHFETGDIRDQSPGVFLKAQASEILSGRDAGADFRMVDVSGTRWRLVAAIPPTRGMANIAFLAAAVAVAALVLELAARGVSGGEPAGTVTAVLRQDKAIPDGMLSQLHELMFKYRITNPDKDRLDSELRVARQIQFSLLPTAYPAHSEWREYDLCASLHPAREIGGDYYDYFTLGPNRLVIAVGDVSGKGMPAALYMAVCRTAFRALARLTDDPGRLLSRVNEMLVRDNKSGLYVTVACFFVDTPSGKCQYAIAGHPAPMLRRAGESGGELLDHPRETVVGMQAGIAYPVGEIQLCPGDTLLLYTDGITEARSPLGEDLDYQGLFGMFNASSEATSCAGIIERLESDVRTYVGEAEQQDDMTLLALRYWGPGGERVANGPRRGTVRMVAGTAPQASSQPEK